MASKHIRKNGDHMVVNDRQLDRFLADGWEQYDPEPESLDPRAAQEALGAEAALRPGQVRMTNGKATCVCDQHQVAKMTKAGWKPEGETKQSTKSEPKAAPAANKGGNDAQHQVEQGKSEDHQREELGADASDEGDDKGKSAAQQR